MTEDAFHAALRNNPADELTWQALADFLEEGGQADRAELLRVTRRMLQLPVPERRDLPEWYGTLLEEGVRPVVVERTNSLGMRLALIPAGRFHMGSPYAEEHRKDDESPVHGVTITRPFWLGVFPVTQKQWAAVMGSNPSHFSASGGGKEHVVGLDTDDFPVESVSWNDAQEFLKVLNARPEEVASGVTYRLPTEAEWEYACRAGADIRYPFCFRKPSLSLASTQANFDGFYPYPYKGPLGPGAGRPLKRTCRVGSYEPNAFGLHDMHGNVSDWCADWFGPYTAGPLIDPVGPPRGEPIHPAGPALRVQRGGSWGSPSFWCRSAARGHAGPSFRSTYCGLRVAASPR